MKTKLGMFGDERHTYFKRRVLNVCQLYYRNDGLYLCGGDDMSAERKDGAHAGQWALLNYMATLEGVTPEAYQRCLKFVNSYGTSEAERKERWALNVRRQQSNSAKG